MAKPSSGLGKGFDVLMPTDFDQSLLLDSKERIQKLSTSEVNPNPDQPRTHFDEASITELAQSVQQYGILQPLIVSPNPDGGYRIIAGERRWRAAVAAGLTHVPAIVRERHELQELEIALIENVQRVDLSPLDQAISIERLHQQFNLSYKDIAGRLAKSVPTVSNIVRLLQLPPEARSALQQNQISEGHARAILALKSDPALQKVLLEQIIKNSWSVRQAEQFVVSHRQGVETKQSIARSKSAETPETKRLSKALHAPVSIKRTAKGGRLELHFKSDADLDALLKLLSQLT